ncbi:ABC transporter related protein [Denitrovibrio acetiphilus DSM 12809]|uniref:ABC transporter related protein n=1 Tax=Denitrovibrio acetiphilus (strain DSM 12809 / NBRC 114555 / N2460) TaxID=522772 RepID=D4H1Z3_DENA2|nr:ABC transporter ATP-binding protein [Denitrovibrio acetiphilus]ADD66970.1 ABC transporter related protein [Denitrovibrio acetiphilus DSM 12809]
MKEIEVSNLTKNFGGVAAVDGISFTVETGSILAFLGPNGAGKTTTVNMLTDLLQPTSGEIRYRGEVFSSDRSDLKRNIGVVPQHNNVDRDLSVYQNLKVHGMLFGMGRGELERRIEEAMEFSGLGGHAGKPAGKLSGGMKRRLIIARALLHEPSILYLDEPTAGLDASVRRTMWDFIRSINVNKNCTVFLTTHYIEEAEMLSDNVIVIDRAKIVAEGDARSLMERIGHWALDILVNDVTETEFFVTREDALARLSATSGTAKLRETNLEDVYLSITGRRIDV